MDETRDGRVWDRQTCVNGLNIHYLLGGTSEEKVVFVHGGAADSARLSWRLICESLAPRFQVVAPDLPGFGESDSPRANFSIPFYVHFLGSFLDQLGIERTTLVALSMGGFISLAFTLKYPHRVSRLVLVDSAGLGPEIPHPLLVFLLVRIPFLHRLLQKCAARSRRFLKRTLRWIFFDSGRLSPSLFEEIRGELLRPDSGKAWHVFLKNQLNWRGFRDHCREGLEKLSLPTLIIHGREDRLIPLHAARRAHQRLPQSRIRIIPACGHWPPRERPEAFESLLEEFLKSESVKMEPEDDAILP